MKFAFIQEHSQQEHSQQERGQQWPVGALCHILGASRSGYAAWCRRRSQTATPRQQEKRQAEARLRLQIRAAHRKGRHY